MELERFVENTWDGDVDFGEVLNEKGIDFELAEQFLIEHPRFVEGLPFPGDDVEWDQLVKTYGGAMALQEIVDRFE